MLRFSTIAIALTLSAAVAGSQNRPGGNGTPTDANGNCPPGMTLTRPRRCQAPQEPAPSIVDYRPKSTLVAPTHLKPKAKYPVIDYHAHVQALLGSAQGIDSLTKAMDELNLGMMLVTDNISGERLTSTMAIVNASPLKDRVRLFTGINFRDVGPGWADKAIAQLEADAKAGAVGIGEINKGLGLSTRKADGTLLKIDDPDLDPVWAAAGRLKLPVFIHTADPERFFAPRDYTNERWLEMALFGERNYTPDKFPSFDELMKQRDNMVRKHPKTVFVIAHMSWYANDLGKLGKLMDEMPNFYTEMGAVLYDVGRQPRAAREFFIKYQDRILFGKDSFQPEEYPYYWRVFETNDDYFDYYRDYHAFWKLYGIDLPDSVLKKIYYQNALKLTPAAPKGAFPK